MTNTRTDLIQMKKWAVNKKNIIKNKKMEGDRNLMSPNLVERIPRQQLMISNHFLESKA